MIGPTPRSNVDNPRPRWYPDALPCGPSFREGGMFVVALTGAVYPSVRSPTGRGLPVSRQRLRAAWRWGADMLRNRR